MCALVHESCLHPLTTHTHTHTHISSNHTPPIHHPSRRYCSGALCDESVDRSVRDRGAFCPVVKPWVGAGWHDQSSCNVSIASTLRQGQCSCEISGEVCNCLPGWSGPNCSARCDKECSHFMMYDFTCSDAMVGCNTEACNFDLDCKVNV
jgi:hypothetical protein